MAQNKEKWDVLSLDYCRKLTENSPKRFQAVKSQESYSTKYTAKISTEILLK